MYYSIQHTGLLTIPDHTENKTYFGPDQAWFQDRWRADAGCGPVSASIIMAYLAFTRPQLRSLYVPGTLNRPDLLRHKIPIYTEGVVSYAAVQGIALEPRVFDVSANLFRKREPSQALADFVAAGLGSDCPIGLLVLSRGKETRLQNWHWITITSAEINGTSIKANASDEGNEITFDLQLWYTTTNLSGGLVYFLPKAAGV